MNLRKNLDTTFLCTRREQQDFKELRRINKFRPENQYDPVYNLKTSMCSLIISGNSAILSEFFSRTTKY